LSYITLDTFAASALTVASYELMQADAASVARELANSYQTDYDDYNLEDDLLEAAESIIDWLKIRFPNETNTASLASACGTLINAIRKFDPNGRKRRKFFRGTIFNKNQDRIEYKASRSVEIIVLYDTMIRNGVIKYSSIN